MIISETPRVSTELRVALWLNGRSSVAQRLKGQRGRKREREEKGAEEAVS